MKVRGNSKEILKGLNLKIMPGEIQALLGPNGSGKSVLAQTISGNPKYRAVQGKILLEGKEITKFPPEKRAKLGIALAWQSPPTIKGLELSGLLERISKTEKKVSHPLAEGLLKREVNLDFSGGEKKLSELMQILALEPKLAIFDEIDSGLDIKKLKQVSEVIRKKLLNRNVSVLLITHWGHILNYLEPDSVNVMLDGKIVCKEKDFKKVIRVIKKHGYEKCRKCLSSAK